MKSKKWQIDRNDRPEVSNIGSENDNITYIIRATLNYVVGNKC